MDAGIYVDSQTLIVCICIGKVIKSSDILKYNNKYIPIILMIVGVVLQFCNTGLSSISFTTGIVSAFAAVGFHQSGKQLLFNNKLMSSDNDNKDDKKEV